MMLTPRPFQTEAKQALLKFWEHNRRGAIVLPTGMGKGYIIADVALELKRLRPMLLVHRDELVRQLAIEVHSVAPDASIGIIKGSRQNELGRDITIASVQTLSRRNRLHLLNPQAFGLLIVDECHHSAADSYLNIIKYFGGFNDGGINDEGAIVAGFTATLVRNDRKGLGDVWQSVVYKRDILWGILHNDNGPCQAGQGYLSDVRGKRIVVDGLDLGNIKRKGGDFSEGDLGAALTDAHIGRVMLKGYLEEGEGRQGIAFLPTVATALEVTQVFHEGGIRAACITGDTPIEDRQLIYKMVRAEEITILVNCMVLTEGFNIPQLSLAMIGRPTQSEGLYVQMVGRVLRSWFGKTHALVLDFVGASEDNRLASLADLSETIKREVLDGESITDAAEREEQEVESRVDGTGTITDVHDIDLFSSRSSAWLRTFRGYWFIPAGDRILCLLPETETEETFTVGNFWSGMGKRQPHKKLAEGINLDYGLAWAESEAEAYEPMTSRRGTSWRKEKYKKATEKQVWKARELGMPEPSTGFENEKRVALSDAISVFIASNIIDRWEPSGSKQEPSGSREGA